MRLPVVLDYHGPAAAHPFNVRLMAHAGAYSDITHLYFRDRIWRHPVPYLDFRFEYPVLTGAFVWAAGLIDGGLLGYFLASSALLLGLALFTVSTLRRIAGANPWLFAAAPALAFYAALNWDLLAIFPFVLALVLFERRRDGWGGATLGVSVAAKLFPVVVLPVVIALRLAE